MPLPALRYPPEREAEARRLGGALLRSLDRPGAADAVEAAFSGKLFRREMLRDALGEDLLDDLAVFNLMDVNGELARSLFSARVVGGRVFITDLPRKGFLREPLYVDPLWEAPAFSRMLVAAQARNGLDLGCGCGALAIAMSGHCQRVWASDINPRALEIARFNAALNGADNITFVESDLFDAFEPNLKFDQVVFNSPVGMEFAARHMLEAGEEVLERFFSALPLRLNTGGVVQVNMCVKDWRGDPFFGRMRRWLGPHAEGFQHVFMQLWRRDAGPRFHLYRLFGSLRSARNCFKCTGVSRGFLTLRRQAGGQSWVLPTNYHLWVHDAPDQAAGRIIIAALDASAAEGEAGGLAPQPETAALLRPVDTRRRPLSAAAMHGSVRRKVWLGAGLGAGIFTLFTFVAYALSAE